VDEEAGSRAATGDDGVVDHEGRLNDDSLAAHGAGELDVEDGDPDESDDGKLGIVAVPDNLVKERDGPRLALNGIEVVFDGSTNTGIAVEGQCAVLPECQLATDVIEIRLGDAIKNLSSEVRGAVVAPAAVYSSEVTGRELADTASGEEVYFIDPVRAGGDGLGFGVMGETVAYGVNVGQQIVPGVHMQSHGQDLGIAGFGGNPVSGDAILEGGGSGSGHTDGVQPENTGEQERDWPVGRGIPSYGDLSGVVLGGIGEVDLLGLVIGIVQVTDLDIIGGYLRTDALNWVEESKGLGSLYGGDLIVTDVRRAGQLVVVEELSGGGSCSCVGGARRGCCRSCPCR